MTDSPICGQCKHPLVLHVNGICGMARCNCHRKGVTPEQAKVLSK